MATVLAVAYPCSLEAQYIWTGLQQPTGWQGQVTPPNNGTAQLYFGDSIYPFVTLTSSLNDVSSIELAQGNDIIFGSASPLTLTLTSTLTSGATAMASADNIPGYLYFDSSINLGITGSQTYNAGANSIYVTGQVTGTGSLTLVDSGGTSGSGAFIFNNTGTGNNYTGPTTIGDGSNFVQVAFWNSSPFGSSSNMVTFNGGELIAHGTQTISNPFTIDSLSSANADTFKSWDDPLTIAGAVTLDRSAVFAIRTAFAAIPAPLNDGSIPVPGPAVNNPVIFTGGISGTLDHLTFLGTGVAILNSSGGDTYTGGTQVGNGTSAGNLVFAAASSIPTTGLILVTANGYLGIADPTTGSFASMLTHVNQGTSLGSYGIDTLPGNSTTMYSGPISLSSFTSTAVEIGSATKGEISGIITPQTSGAYQFGGGGGTLYVDSPLLNTGAATVSVSNPGNSFPLTVYLQGSNTYVGGTTVNDGFLIFNGPSSLPPIGSLTAAGSGSNIGGSYIGYTDLAGLTPTTFLGRFSQANTWGIVGFDSSNVSSPVTITNNIDLTGFNNGVFIGTATAAVLGGSITITPTADDTYRFTAAQNGVLTIDTPLTWGNGVILGSPNFPQYSSGTVIMNGANTYSGGTTINGGSYGLTVGLGTNSAFGGAGGGTVSISAGGLVGIEATAAGIVLPNNITFLDPSPPGSAQLYLRGTNSFTLSGNLTGDSSAGIVLENSSPLTVTLSGNNSGYSGFYSVYNGTLVLSSTSALGNATLNFEGPGTIDLSAAVNPIIQTISGAENNGTLGTLILPSSGTLTFNTTNDTTDNNPTFGGTITGSGGIIVDDTSGGSSGAVVLLYGNNTYSGGTTIVDGGVLAAASNTALGTGPVTLDATSGHGALALDSGVTLTNPLTLTAGFLVGDGTFNPSSLGLAGTITIGPNQGVAGGLPFGNNDIIPGTLNFAGNLAFNTGGAYYWTLQDDSRTDGMSSISVAGNLTINATAGGFTIYAVTFDAGGNKGNPPGSFSLYSPASWTILTTGGTIQNFSASDFTINSTNFDGGVAASHFSLSVNGSDNQLILNFTPVPEPSTWALLATGLGLISVAMIGRRRTAAAL